MLRPHAGEEPDHVLVLGTLGAPQRRMIGAKRPRKVDPEPPPEPVRTTRVTLIDAKALADEAAAKAWLAEVDGELRVADAIPVLNRVLHLHRIASADPGPRDVTRELAIVARIGYGVGEQVSTGRSTAALELPMPDGVRRSRRTAALRPQERLAALLSGRDAALACEELALRARADLDGGRPREAALTLRVALEAALAELEPWADRADLAERIITLAEDRYAVGAAANRALQGGLDDEEMAAVRTTLGHIEAALRARTAGGID